MYFLLGTYLLLLGSRWVTTLPGQEVAGIYYVGRVMSWPQAAEYNYKMGDAGPSPCHLVSSLV
jgi:hypothetical protein